jgi:Skp family chaperone for outer membrane proteins
MKNRTRFLGLAVLFCSVLAAQQAPKIGIIDLQRALAATQEGQQATKGLRAKVDPKQNEFNARQQEITQLQEQLNRPAVLSEEKKAELARSIDEKKRRLDRDTQDANDSLRSELQGILQKMSQRLMTVLTKYAKDYGYTLILEAGAPNTPLMYAAPEMDITSTIVGLYDKAYPNTPSTPPAAVPKP